MSNEVRQAWQRFYAAALPAFIAKGYAGTEAHNYALLHADKAAAHYATLIPVKQPSPNAR